MNYKKHEVTPIADVDKNNIQLQTLAYFGYFIPDRNDSLCASKNVTAAEFDLLLSDLKLYRKLKGKTIVGFGDSIMRGQGNSGHSVVEVIGVFVQLLRSKETVFTKLSVKVQGLEKTLLISFVSPKVVYFISFVPPLKTIKSADCFLLIALFIWSII